MIKVYCNGTRIQCLRQGELTVGMVGAPVEFDFSSEWDGLGKIAVFTCDGTRDVILDAEGKAVVPHEILTTPGMDVEVGVYAVREDGTTWPAPTPVCRIGRVKTGADPSGDESYPPTPSVGEQLQNQINSLGERVDKLEDGGGSGGSIELDTTLTVEGKAADAKAVGDALDELEAKIGEDGSGGSAEIPFFNLAEMGLGAVTAGGFWASLATDTSEIRAALEKGLVKFGLEYNYEGANIYVEMTGGVLYADALGESYQIVQNGVLGDDSIMLSVMVQPDGIGAVANKLLDRLDETLSIEGVPADAKAVGNALANVTGKAYVQPDEPIDAPIGTLWYDTDEETSGGGTSIELDVTLTQSGKAADAKAVGDALAKINNSGGGSGEDDVLITVEDIDAICGASISMASEVLF